MADNASRDSRTQDPESHSDEKIREILAHSPAGIGIITRDRFEPLFINFRMIELLGIAGREETPGIDTFVNVEDYEHVMAQMAQGVIIEGDEYLRRRIDDGRLWWSLLHVRPAVFEGREAAIIWLYDVTELKTMETKFRHLTSTQSDWLWEVDENLIFTSFTENFYASTNLRPEQIVGKSISEWEQESGGPDGQLSAIRRQASCPPAGQQSRD